MFRFCLEKGWVWVDLSESTAVAAVVHYDARKKNFEDNPDLLVFSKDFDVSVLPSRFKADMNKWLTDEGVDRKITKFFINATGKAAKF